MPSDTSSKTVSDMAAKAHSRRAQRPWSKTSPTDRTWDTIVIGSGMGGMTTAALLAQAGDKVLVVEQHYVPGGFTHAFRRKGFSWDVGVHLIGEVTEHASNGRLLAELTNGELKWESIGRIYDTFTFPDGERFDFPDTPQAFEDMLCAAFPDHTHEVRAYLDAVRTTARKLRSFYLGRALPTGVGRLFGRMISREAEADMTRTVDEALDGVITNPKLKALVCAQWGYQGSPPSEASWGLHCGLIRHFLHGAYYPVGGAPRIAETLLKTVAEAGGWTRIHSPVKSIDLAHGKAVGVTLESGEQLRAKRVVSAIGAVPTVTRLLPPSVAGADWAKSVAKLKAGPAHVCLYLGFHGDIAAAGATKASQWLYNTWDHEQGVWQVQAGQPLGPAPTVFVSYPSLKDPEHDPGPQHKHTGEIVTFVPWESFEAWRGTDWRKRGSDYEAFKAAMSEQLLKQLFEAHPGLQPLLVHHELSTPLSTDLFVRPQKGSIYGLATTPDRYANPWLRPQSPVPNLWMSGQDVVSCGIMGAFTGGMICAAAMEPLRIAPRVARA